MFLRWSSLCEYSIIFNHLYIVPTAPTNFQIIDASMGEVTLSWTEPLQSNGMITKYILYYGSIKTGEVKYEELTADVRTFKVRQLSPTDAYIFKLAAHTSAGDSKKTTLSFDLSKGIYNFSLKPEFLSLQLIKMLIQYYLMNVRWTLALEEINISLFINFVFIIIREGFLFFEIPNKNCL